MRLKYPKNLTSKAEFLMLSLEDKVRLLKFCYGFEDEEEVLPSDILFDNMVSALPDTSPIKYIDWDMITYEEVKDIIQQVGIQVLTDDETIASTVTETYQDLQKLWGKNRSITMDDDINHAFGIAKDMFNVYSESKYKDEMYKILMLLKYDGWNLTVYYVPGQDKPVLIHTRARYGDCIYCTELLKDIMPEVSTNETVRVVGELCLDEEALVILRNHYHDGREFKNTRNSVSSVVHGTVDINLIKNHIHFYAFAAETPTEKACGTVLETLDLLDRLGFETPKRCVVTSPDTFQVCFDYMTEEYKKIESSVKCDGVVMEPNHYDIQSECNEFIAGNNQLGLLAIKDLYWSRKLYEGEVIDIISPPAKQNRSLIAIIKPVVTSSGSTAQRIPLINFRRAAMYGRYVDVGDIILFTYHSEQNIHFEGFKEVIQ